VEEIASLTGLLCLEILPAFAASVFVHAIDHANGAAAVNKQFRVVAIVRVTVPKLHVLEVTAIVTGRA